ACLKFRFVSSPQRWRQCERISTAFVESTINQVVSGRFVKKQQMQWTLPGVHLLLQTRTKVSTTNWKESSGVGTHNSGRKQHDPRLIAALCRARPLLAIASTVCLSRIG